MLAASIKVINIAWERIPFSKEEVAKYNKNTDAGVYQIYGQHPSYGENALLYIGKAESFANRLYERCEFIESCAIPTDIRLGRLVNSVDDNDILNIPVECKWQMIDIAENILIKSHAPAFNKQENSGLYSANVEEFNGDHYMLLNWEDYGNILPEISTLKMSYRFWKFEKPLEY